MFPCIKYILMLILLNFDFFRFSFKTNVVYTRIDYLIYCNSGEVSTVGSFTSSIPIFIASNQNSKIRLTVFAGTFPASFSTPHNYENSKTYSSDDIIAAGASGYSLSFSASTSTEASYDYFYVYSSSANTQLYKNSGSFGGTSQTVYSSTGVYFKFVTDSSNVYYGVDVTITPVCSSGSFVSGSTNCCAAGNFMYFLINVNQNQFVFLISVISTFGFFVPLFVNLLSSKLVQ
jgi:hypothetical protein